MLRPLVLLIALLLPACGPEQPTEQNIIARSPRDTAASEPPKQPEPQAQSPAAKPAPRLVLAPDGLRLSGADGAGARLLPFGMAQRELIPLLESFRGPADRGTNSECGAGPLDYTVWADGLTLHFQEGKFAGWAADERAEGVHATASGVGPGSPRAALAAAYEARVEQSSLGTEFAAGELYGVLSGDKPDARVTAMWAGVSCVFR